MPKMVREIFEFVHVAALNLPFVSLMGGTTFHVSYYGRYICAGKGFCCGLLAKEVETGGKREHSYQRSVCCFVYMLMHGRLFERA